MSDMSEAQVAPGEVATDSTGNQEPAPAAVDPVSVVARQPSSANETQQPEAAPEAAAEPPVSLEDAVKALLIFVKAHRTIGDADLAASVADVEAALSS